jgi:methyl-accepting chemotaxis protein
MPVPDPIAPVVSALSVLVTPNPVPPTAAPYPAPSVWEGGTATNGTLYTPIQTFLGVLFHVSPDMTTVSKGINTALTDVAKVVTVIADNLANVGSLTDVTSAMTALQNSLSLAQALAPGSTTAVLNSASGLFQQVQNLLSSIQAAGGTIGQAAAELAELSQQLTALAQLFPTS